MVYFVRIGSRGNVIFCVGLLGIIWVELVLLVVIVGWVVSVFMYVVLDLVWLVKVSICLWFGVCWGCFIWLLVVLWYIWIVGDVWLVGVYCWLGLVWLYGKCFWVFFSFVCWLCFVLVVRYYLCCWCGRMFVLLGLCWRLVVGSLCVVVCLFCVVLLVCVCWWICVRCGWLLGSLYVVGWRLGIVGWCCVRCLLGLLFILWVVWLLIGSYWLRLLWWGWLGGCGGCVNGLLLLLLGSIGRWWCSGLVLCVSVFRSWLCWLFCMVNWSWVGSGCWICVLGWVLCLSNWRSWNIVVVCSLVLWFMFFRIVCCWFGWIWCWYMGWWCWLVVFFWLGWL